MSQAGYYPFNNLGSRQAPSRIQPVSYQQEATEDLPRFRRDTTQHPGWDQQSDSPFIKPFYVPELSTVEYSSFSSSNEIPPSYDFAGGSIKRDTRSPIPFVFEASSSSPKPQANKMVNETSPAKAPLHPVLPNEQHPTTADSSLSSKPAQSSVPRFGEPTFPQSPLKKHQPQPRPREPMFIQPKSRPEHHREAPAHPHFQALKDATRRVIDPFLPRAPADWHAPPSHGTIASVAAPTYAAPTYTDTQAAAPPKFSSNGNIYGGFQSVNGHSNYIDLTRNEYRTSSIPDPFTFVDPAKAQEDLKALLEGVMEDEDDMPRTRSRKKKKDTAIDDLTAKLKGLEVEQEKFEVASDDEEDDGTVDGIKVKLLPHQVDGLEWMAGRELGTGKKGQVPKGGILADDMGLGKTLQSISLIISNPKPTDEAVIEKRKLPSGVEKCTLVVAPLALIRQWELEIKDKVTNSHSLRVIVHHGPQRTKRFQDLKKYDVVITTYQILVSEFGSSSEDQNGIKVGCFGLHWYRVILDEAHTIKNRNAKATKACYALRSEYRWCLTGTPMQNNLEELQSLIKFLRITPYDDLREFKDQIDRPMKNGRGDLAIKRLRAFLKICMKRRTKDILKKDGALNPGGKISAPGEKSTTGFKVTERKIEKVFVEFSTEERHFYERLEQRTDMSIEQMMHDADKVSYASALVLLLRLRQACNHPKLVAGKLGKDTEALAGDSGTANQKAKDKATNAQVDDLADMFGSLDVGSKKCEVCQLELGKQAIADGAIRCLDCEADLDAMDNQNSRKDRRKKKKNEKRQHRKIKPELKSLARKPRNRAIIMDSDDEEDGEEGSWIVSKDQRVSLKLGKAGGLADENAEGGGEWLDSEDDSFPDLKDIGSKQQPIEVDDSESDSEEDSSEDDKTDSTETNSDEDVEDEFGDSEEEKQLATMAASTKITHLIRILGNEITDHKFIVFSQFTSMLDLIEPFLRQKGYKFTRYDGSMRNDLREASLDKLRNDKNCRILLCSLKCGSLGLNLTAATRVVILEPFWNPFVEEQAIDRVHRLTQKIDVVVYKITISNSVEERILALQEKKRELANQTIEGGKGGAGKLGMKEILQLFRRDAEHLSAGPAAAQYDISKPRILKEGLTSGGNSSRDWSAPAERKVTPPAERRIAPKEDAIYGRRW